MLQVETIDLAGRGIILPGDKVGMVMAQPFLQLTPVEPFRCADGHKDQCLAELRATLDVAQAVPHGCPKTHFTLFPEYSIPGLDGIALIEQRLQQPEWPTGTVVIGGTDALSKDDFCALATAGSTYLNQIDAAPDRISPQEWVNCAIIWVKGDRGVERWLQPKIHPAWPEQNISHQSMFHGKSVFVFRGALDTGTPFLFSTVTCFDWIAAVDGTKIWRGITNELSRQATQVGAELPLSWFFVIQCNDKPSHDTFLREVTDFFNQTVTPNVRRDRTCLVFANTAGKELPGRADKYGCSSLIFSQQVLFTQPSCHPTFSNGGQRFRASTLLTSCQDVLFRERGACIHSFAQVNPGSVVAGAGGRTIALGNAYVFPMPGGTGPRAPAASVPACLKWLNDELDSLTNLGLKYPSANLATSIKVRHLDTVASLRLIGPQAATHSIELATADSKADNADEWSTAETNGLSNLVETFDIMRLGCDVSVGGSDPAHGSARLNQHNLDVIAVNGPTHEACIKHAQDKMVSPRPRRQTLVVSRDADNNNWSKRYGSFLEEQSDKLGDERDITDPFSGWLHVGFRKLLEAFQTSADITAIQRIINADLI